MKNKIKTMRKTDLIILIAVIIVAITNMWAIGYIDYALELFIVYLIEYGKYANAIGLLVIAVCIIINTRESGKVNIPSKYAETEKAGKFKNKI